MIPLPGLWCIRCRGMAYDDDDALACMICGRTLAVRPPRSLPFRTVKIQQDEERRKLGMIRYPPELKAIALGWLLEGESAEDVAGVTGLSIETLRTWAHGKRSVLGFQCGIATLKSSGPSAWRGCGLGKRPLPCRRKPVYRSTCWVIGGALRRKRNRGRQFYGNTENNINAR